MPRTCTVCNHNNRQAIEETLLSGEPFRNVAKQFGTSSTALFRHKTEHLLEAIQKSHEASEVLRADALVDHVKQLRDRTEMLFAEAEGILRQAKRAKDLRTALAAIREAANVTREARGNATLLGQLTGELQQSVHGAAQVMVVLPLSRSEPGASATQESVVVDIAGTYGR